MHSAQVPGIQEAASLYVDEAVAGSDPIGREQGSELEGIGAEEEQAAVGNMLRARKVLLLVHRMKNRRIPSHLRVSQNCGSSDSSARVRTEELLGAPYVSMAGVGKVLAEEVVLLHSEPSGLMVDQVHVGR